MNNRIDFYQSEQTALAIPAASVTVYLNGTATAELVPVEVVRTGWPEFSWTRLVYNPTGCDGAGFIAAERIEDSFPMGSAISIRQNYADSPPGAGTFSMVIFDGQIETIETDLNDDGEKVTLIARDFSAEFERVTLYGQRLSDNGSASKFLPGIDTVFNPDGRPNASTCPINVGSLDHTVFSAESLLARPWSYAQAIYYLLCEYLPSGRLGMPDVLRLQGLTDNKIVSDLDVTGLNLIEALHRCCERTGLKFGFVPCQEPTGSGATGPGQAIVFYKNETARTVEMNCQKYGQQLSISRTNVATLHSRKNLWPVTHRYIGQGDFKVYEATFELIKAWDPADESTDYQKFSPSGNTDFYKVKDVYRKWCLNESGRYSEAPYNQGPSFDFSKIFQTTDFVHRPRRFWPALSADKQGRSLSYYLQVSYDDGMHWWQYVYAFSNLLDECGLWLSSDRLDVDTWVAALKGVLKFRITASVLSDERLSCIVADGPVNSTVPVIEQVITLPRQFKFRKVSQQSIFAGASGQILGEADEVDDMALLYEFVRSRSTASPAIIETIDIRTPTLAFDYLPGDRVVSSPQSRDLFSCTRDNRSRSWIERVHIDFTEQCTNLKIIRHR